MSVAAADPQAVTRKELVCSDQHGMQDMHEDQQEDTDRKRAVDLHPSGFSSQ